MIKKLFLLSAVLLAASWVIQAQNQETFLTVVTSSGTDDFSLEGGEVQILNNTVSIVYEEDATLNRSYVFDNVESFTFALRNVTGIESVDVNRFNAYIDKNDVLYISSPVQALGTIHVYAISGTLVASIESDSNTAAFNLSAQPKGAYIVQVGINKVKIIK